MFNCIKHKPKSKVIYSTPNKKSDIFIGLVIGHNENAQGATNYLGESEWTFNKRIAHKLHISLADEGIQSAILFRPNSGGYTHECNYTAKELVRLGCKMSLHLHFNSAGPTARGCEVLVLDTPEQEDNVLADSISDILNEEYGIKERHDDGILVINRSHNGYGMLHAAYSNGILPALVEPCFADHATSESVVIFEQEDLYVDALARAIKVAYDKSSSKL